MKKNFTLKKSLLVAALAFVAVGAQAQEEPEYKYIPLWGQLKAHPENAGKVYAGMTSSGVDPEGNDYAEPAPVKDVKFAARWTLSMNTGTFYGYAVPNEGWNVAGFAPQDYVDGEPVVPTKVKWTTNPRSLSLTSQVYTRNQMLETKEEAFTKFPAEPDGVYYALFTRVTVGIDYFNEELGTVKIDKVLNDIGTEVTITATAYEDKKAKFAYWVEENTGNKIEDNPYTFTVSGAAHYTPVFTSDNFFAVEFPEEGGYVEYYKEENLAYFPKTVQRVNCLKEDLKKSGKNVYLEVENYAEAIPAMTPTYFYGKGTQYFLDDPADKTSTMFYYGIPLEQWSGADGVEISTIELTIKVPINDKEEKDSIVGNVSAYLLNAEKEVFERVTEAKVPVNRVFLAIPQYFLDQVEEGFVPDVIYLSEEDAEAASVDGVQVDKSVKNGKTYTLDGKQVAAPKQNGIYIYDGKKLIFRK